MPAGVAGMTADDAGIADEAAIADEAGSADDAGMSGAAEAASMLLAGWMLTVFDGWESGRSPAMPRMFSWEVLVKYMESEGGERTVRSAETSAPRRDIIVK